MQRCDLRRRDNTEQVKSRTLGEIQEQDASNQARGSPIQGIHPIIQYYPPAALRSMMMMMIPALRSPCNDLVVGIGVLRSYRAHTDIDGAQIAVNRQAARSRNIADHFSKLFRSYVCTCCTVQLTRQTDHQSKRARTSAHTRRPRRLCGPGCTSTRASGTCGCGHAHTKVVRPEGQPQLRLNSWQQLPLVIVQSCSRHNCQY